MINAGWPGMPGDVAPTSSQPRFAWVVNDGNAQIHDHVALHQRRLGNIQAAPEDDQQAERIAALIKQLGDKSFTKREAAEKELEAIGPAATKALQLVAVKGDDPEIRQRAERLLNKRFSELRYLKGHTSIVHSVAFSPDGKQALSGSRDKTVRLWDLETGKEIHCFAGHTGTVLCVAFSRDGKFALSGANDKTVRVWDIATGKELRSFDHAGGIGSLVPAPDGKRALWAGGGLKV